MEQLIKLSEIFLSVERLPWQWTLFLPAHRDWTVDTEGAVLDTEDEENPDSPVFAQKHDLMIVLNVSELQDIISNAKQQNPNVGVPELFQSFKFYLHRDAFIDFSYAGSDSNLV